MKRFLWMSLLLLWVSMPVGAAAKDLKIRLHVVGGTVSPAPRDDVEYWTAHLRIYDGQLVRTILDFDKQTITNMQKRKHLYAVHTFESLRKYAETVRQQLKNAPPQARKLAGPDEPPVDVKATGRSEKILGYDAKEYNVSAGRLSATLWVTDAIDIAARAQEAAKVDALIGDIRSPGRRLAEARSQIKGLPLRVTATVRLGTQTITSSNEVVEITEEAPPADLLTVPNGYVQSEDVKPGMP